MEDEVLNFNLESRRIAPISGISVNRAADDIMINRMDNVNTRISTLEQENNDLKGMVNDLEHRNWELESKLDEKTRFYETQLYGFIRLVVAVLKEIDKDKFNRTLYTMKELLDCFDYSNSNEYYLTPNGEEVDEDIIE